MTKIPKNPGSCALVVYIAGDTLHHQPMGAGHMTVLQLCGPMGFRALQWCHPMPVQTKRTSYCTRMITICGLFESGFRPMQKKQKDKVAEAEPGPPKINTRNSGVSSDVDQNTQKHGSKSEHRKGATKACKNRGEKRNSVREKERVSDSASGEQLKNRDDNKSVVEMAETGNSIAEKELDVGKQVMSGGTSGEQILNANDDDQSVDETSQTGNGVGETEGVSDGALAEPIINRDDNKSVVEMAVNSVGEKESDAVKQVIISGGASGEPIPNLHDNDQKVDETSQTANGVGETEGVSDGPLAEPIINRDDNKNIDETPVNSVGEKESDAVKQVIKYDGASSEQIPNPNDDDQSVDETSRTGNGVNEPEGVSDGTLAEPIKNPHDNKSVDETAEIVNSVGEKESML